MKKIRIAAAAAAILSAGAVNTYAMEADITPYVYEDNQWIEISGTADKEYQNIAIKVLKSEKENSENTNDAILLTTVTSNENKNFTRSFRVPSGISEGVYVFNFKDSDGTELRKEFNITSLEVTLEKFEIICTSDAVSDVENALQTHAHAIGIDTEVYGILTDTQKSDAVSMFIINRNATEKTEFSVEEISELLEEASVVEQIKSSEGNALSAMSLYEDELELKKNGVYVKYAANIDNNMFSRICERTVKRSDDYSTLSGIQDTYELQILLEIIQNGGSWYTTQNVIDNNYEKLGLTSADISKVSSLKQPGVVYQNLTGAELYTQTEFETAFETAYSNALKSQNSASGNNSTGGGSGGGGGGNFMPPVTPVTPVTPDTDNAANNENKEETSGFDDVKTDTPWAEEAVNELLKRKIVNGKSENKFAPNDLVTREEFAKMLVLAVGFATSDGDDTGFWDVDENMWYAAYVKAAKTNGVITGKSDTLFGIGQNITRQDMAVMIYRAMGSAKPSADMPFSDSNEVSDYAQNAVSYMSEKGIINGQSDNMFAPKSFATRAEAAVMLCNMIKFNNIQ